MDKNHLETDEYRLDQLEKKVEKLEGLETNDSVWIHDFKLGWRIIYISSGVLWTVIIGLVTFLITHHTNLARVGKLLTK